MMYDLALHSCRYARFLIKQPERRKTRTPRGLAGFEAHMRCCASCQAYEASLAAAGGCVALADTTGREPIALSFPFLDTPAQRRFRHRCRRLLLATVIFAASTPLVWLTLGWQLALVDLAFSLLCLAFVAFADEPHGYCDLRYWCSC